MILNIAQLIWFGVLNVETCPHGCFAMMIFIRSTYSFEQICRPSSSPVVSNKKREYRIVLPKKYEALHFFVFES